MNYKLFVERFKVLITSDDLLLEKFSRYSKLEVLSALYFFLIIKT